MVKLGAGDLGIGVDKGLLVDAPDAFKIADVECVLGAATARTVAFKLAKDGLSRSWPFPSPRPALRSAPALPGAPGLALMAWIALEPFASHGSKSSVIFDCRGASV